MYIYIFIVYHEYMQIIGGPGPPEAAGRSPRAETPPLVGFFSLGRRDLLLPGGVPLARLVASPQPHELLLLGVVARELLVLVQDIFLLLCFASFESGEEVRHKFAVIGTRLLLDLDRLILRARLGFRCHGS